jgi:hypothetical protein
MRPVQQTSKTLDRGINKFSHDLYSLFDVVLSTPYLMNCDAAANVLARNCKLFARASLLAIDKSKGLTLPSLSYVLHDGSISPTRVAPTDFLSEFGGSGHNMISFDGNSSTCTFCITDINSRSALVDLLSSFSSLYDHMVTISHNYKNYIAGEIYFHAKPREDDAFYPRFDSVEDVCSTLEQLYQVKAQYFIYIGSRNPKRLRMDAGFLTYDRKTIASFCKRKSFGAAFIRDLRNVISLRQSRIGRFGIHGGTFYAVFPVYDPNIRGRHVPPDGIVVILSTNPLGPFVMTAAQDWLNAFSSKRHIQKSSVLARCLKRAEDEIRLIGLNATRTQRGGCFRTIARYLCEQICFSTHAASVSIRLVDSMAGVLTKVAEYQSNWGTYDPVISDHRDMDIPIQMISDSFIAFAATHGGSRNVLILDDVDVIPREYQKSGFRRILKHHRFTRTEAVARVIAGKSLVGLMNIEAPVSGSLRQHVEFFEECASFLGELHLRLFSLTDSDGLAMMAKAHVELHSVADMLREWKPEDSKGAVQIVRHLKRIQDRPMPLSNVERKVLSFPRGQDFGSDLKRFNSSLRAWIKYALHAKGYYELNADAILNGRVPLHLPRDMVPSLYVIMTSIVETVLDRPTWSKHKVTFSDERNSVASSRKLVIDWSSREPMDLIVDRDSLFLKPWVDARANEHFGFFLIGTYVRKIGGTVEFGDTKVNGGKLAGFSIRISLPYDLPSSSAVKRRKHHE